jgi:hypothetical protein
LKQHGYEATPDAVGARIGPFLAPDGGRFRKTLFRVKAPKVGFRPMGGTMLLFPESSGKSGRFGAIPDTT